MRYRQQSEIDTKTQQEKHFGWLRSETVMLWWRQLLLPVRNRHLLNLEVDHDILNHPQI
jgi:hypothetical protein